jgi:hypothetical protein
MAQKKRRSRALSDLAQERELDNALRTVIYAAVRQAKRTGLFVAIRVPAVFLRKLVELNQRRTRQITEN